MWFYCRKWSDHVDLRIFVLTHSDTAPLQRESLGRQRVGQHQVIYVYPVHPGPGVTKPETEQPTLHIHLREKVVDSLIVLWMISCSLAQIFICECSEHVLIQFVET